MSASGDLSIPFHASYTLIPLPLLRHRQPSDCHDFLAPAVKSNCATEHDGSTFRFSRGVHDPHIDLLGNTHSRVLNILLTRFQDLDLGLARNGELQSRISRTVFFSTACAWYYVAQLVDALNHMHLRGVTRGRI
jgi:hypothetical protein